MIPDEQEEGKTSARILIRGIGNAPQKTSNPKPVVEERVKKDAKDPPGAKEERNEEVPTNQVAGRKQPKYTSTP